MSCHNCNCESCAREHLNGQSESMVDTKDAALIAFNKQSSLISELRSRAEIAEAQVSKLEFISSAFNRQVDEIAELERKERYRIAIDLIEKWSTESVECDDESDKTEE